MRSFSEDLLSFSFFLLIALRDYLQILLKKSPNKTWLSKTKQNHKNKTNLFQFAIYLSISYNLWSLIISLILIHIWYFLWIVLLHKFLSFQCVLNIFKLIRQLFFHHFLGYWILSLNQSTISIFLQPLETFLVNFIIIHKS